jgi:brefeldin A-inhibited guanine nucleotide-exchange protein
VDYGHDSTDFGPTFGHADELNPSGDPALAMWFPLHFAMYEIIMNCELEARTRGLNYLFQTLRSHGDKFTPEFWDVISRGVLFPIFDDLRMTGSETRQFENREDMAVWLNTTLIQALRQLVDLVTFWFDILEARLLVGVLGLIKVCFSVPQENETIARIGSSCLQQLITDNCTRLRDEHWDLICTTIEELFEAASAQFLFNPDFMKEVLIRAGDGKNPISNLNVKNSMDMLAVSNTSREESEYDESQASETRSPSSSTQSPRQLKREFQQIIIKSVIQLIVIQTVSDLLLNENEKSVWRVMKSVHIMRLLKCLGQSYEFARRFNNDLPYRMALYRLKFMNQLPNLLKQETSAASCLLKFLFRMHIDAQVEWAAQEDRKTVITDVDNMLLRIVSEILRHYGQLDPSTKQRNIQAWNPVLSQIFDGMLAMTNSGFKLFVSECYSPVLNIIGRHDLPADLKKSFYSLLVRTDELWAISKVRESDQ